MTDTLAVVRMVILGTSLSNPSKNPCKFERVKAYLFDIKREESEIMAYRKAHSRSADGRFPFTGPAHPGRPPGQVCGMASLSDPCTTVLKTLLRTVRSKSPCSEHGRYTHTGGKNHL